MLNALFFIFLQIFLTDARSPVRARASENPQITVWAKNPAAARAYFPKNFRVLDAKHRSEEARKKGILPLAERDALFRKLRIESRLKALDDADKDALVMIAPHYTAAELHRQYPMLTVPQLKGLKAELGQIK
ncbi:MAG: hypothetical protein AB7G93_06440 [Bdellovibrionales bacterium]